MEFLFPFDFKKVGGNDESVNVSYVVGRVQYTLKLSVCHIELKNNGSQ